MYKKIIKRGLDIVLSVLAIVILFPVFFVISAIILCCMGRPILFGQDRVGKDEKIFKLYKFRSMTNVTDQEGKLLPEEQRLTKLGIFLRSTSLDELPELFCILKGDMSFVGPRPLPDYYMPFYHNHERKRHSVKGGLIPPDGLSGKAIVSWEEQFKYEVDYVSNISFTLDIRIIFATFLILLRRVKDSYGSEFRPHLNEYRQKTYNP